MTKIAIIEDDPTIHQMYRMKFEADGFEVELADDGGHGVAMVKAFQPDVLLLDLQMPGVSGVDVLHKIRSHDWGKKLPVIILTNIGKEEAPEELSELDISGYIVKAELTPRQVVEHVKLVLASR